MSLTPLQKHIYNHGSEEVIRKGKKIYFSKGVSLGPIDADSRKVSFKVKNDTFNYYYTVKINHFDDTSRINIRCQCPYNMGSLCRHEVAALLELNDMVESGYFSEGDTEYDQSKTSIRMKDIDLNTLRMLPSNTIFKSGNELTKKNKVKIVSAENDTVEAYIKEGESRHEITITKSETQIYDTSCTCDETKYPICEHKVAVFIQLLNTFGSNYFDTIKDPNKLKNKLLARYGYSLESEDWESKFEFTEIEGRTFLKVLDPTLKPVSNNVFAQPKSTVAHAAVRKKKVDKFKKRSENFGLGVLFIETDVYPYYSITLISGEMDKDRTRFVDQVDYLDLGNKSFLHSYTLDSEKELIKKTQRLTDNNIISFVKKNTPVADYIDLDDLKAIEKNMDKSEYISLIKEYLSPKLKPFFELIKEHNIPTVKLNKKKKLLTNNLQNIDINASVVSGRIETKVLKTSIKVEFKLSSNGKNITYDSSLPEKIIHEKGKTLYLIENQNLDLELISELPQKVSFKKWPQYAYDNIARMQKTTEVKIDDALIQKLENVDPEFQVEFTDNENTLKIAPKFKYKNAVAKWNNEENILTFHPEEGILEVKRNKPLEQQFIEGIRALHHNYISNQQPFFSIRKKDVLKKSWFFKLYDYLLQAEAETIGMENLQNYKISTLKPKTQIQISSGTDWFDTKLNVVYGDEEISIKKIRRALLKGNSYVKLKDGSLALLPEEWLEKYAMIVKMGNENEDKLRLNKVNFALLEDIKDEIDDYKVLEELDSKRKNLMEYNFDDHNKKTKIPKLKGTDLRHYQEQGFQWLSYLSHIQWGGILADDMGLGKTIQTLALLKHYLEDHTEAKILIIAPTSLMYNWENEITKFTPKISYTTHHGPKRTKSTKNLYKDNNVVLSTYGTIRSDVDKFSEIEFDYIVLDESQNIKNPLSLIAKSVTQLQAKNRLCLSGTPLQNNTFDIYSQMNFLNPGMLGSIEFFKNDIANPIDKQQDEQAKKHLHKILYPFILRRTKEQVAPDLPEKTESVFYVDMEENQRKIYESYKDFYRNQIMNEISTQGLGKSKFTILQGLTKLRQRCDSPAILPDDTEYKDEAAKVSQLTAQIQEIRQEGHKALVFSQFIGMLSLIRKSFDKAGINYAYFDGSTSTMERQKQIDKFQNDPDCHTFLISLRAGGVGLNLTSADYVYLVDPWWNPAIEAQAIDRTHRIGQDKNIFAYRMICKDSIEEKILKLQEKKKSLVKDIISDDSGFVKNLKKKTSCTSSLSS